MNKEDKTYKTFILTDVGEKEEVEEFEETNVSEEQVLFNNLSSENREFILKQMRVLQPSEEVSVNE